MKLKNDLLKLLRISYFITIIYSSFQGLTSLWWRNIDFIVNKDSFQEDESVRERFIGPLYSFHKEVIQLTSPDDRIAVVTKSPPWFTAYYLLPRMLYWYWGDFEDIKKQVFINWVKEKNVEWVIVLNNEWSFTPGKSLIIKGTDILSGHLH